MKDLEDILSGIVAKDVHSIQQVTKILKEKMKPEGSLGVLEELVQKMAGIYSYPLPPIQRKCHIVAVADNGIIEEKVSSCPLEYTRLVSEAMLHNMATIGIFTKQLGIDLQVVDIGMKEDIQKEYSNFYRRKIRRGSRNFTKEAAMTKEECERAILEGFSFIGEKQKEYDIFSNGEMGIGNTTTSSAVLYAMTEKNIHDVVGHGGGLSEEGLVRKKRIIQDACQKYQLFGKESLEILRIVGGYDIAFLVGCYLGSAFYRKAMIVDGFISAVAALIACRLKAEVQDYCIFSHQSEEPGMRIILEELGESTFLQMKMRLGEGTGAVLVYPMIDCAFAMFQILRTPKEIYDMFYEQ